MDPVCTCSSLIVDFERHLLHILLLAIKLPRRRRGRAMCENTQLEVPKLVAITFLRCMARVVAVLVVGSPKVSQQIQIFLKT